MCQPLTPHPISRHSGLDPESLPAHLAVWYIPPLNRQKRGGTGRLTANSSLFATPSARLTVVKQTPSSRYAGPFPAQGLRTIPFLTIRSRMHHTARCTGLESAVGLLILGPPTAIMGCFCGRPAKKWTTYRSAGGVPFFGTSPAKTAIFAGNLHNFGTSPALPRR